jgi:hypothetical protein
MMNRLTYAASVAFPALAHLQVEAHTELLRPELAAKPERNSISIALRVEGTRLYLAVSQRQSAIDYIRSQSHGRDWQALELSRFSNLIAQGVATIGNSMKVAWPGAW